MQRTPGLKFATIAQGVAGTTQLVAATAGKKIVVLNYAITLSAAGTAKFQSAATDITGAMDFAAQGGSVAAAGDSIVALFETNPGEALNLVTTGGAGKGHLAYFLSDT